MGARAERASARPMTCSKHGVPMVAKGRLIEGAYRLDGHSIKICPRCCREAQALVRKLQRRRSR
jgi:hypothetical protein